MIIRSIVIIITTLISLTVNIFKANTTDFNASELPRIPTPIPKLVIPTLSEQSEENPEIKGLEILANLSNLKKLDLKDPNIIDKDFKDSSEAIFELSKKIPNCIISTRINGKGIQIQDGKEI